MSKKEATTLKKAIPAYMEYLKSQGKAERTLYTYGKDFEQITTFFGEKKQLTAIRPTDVGKFLKSDALLTLPSGKTRAVPTIEKTIRVLRMFLEWSVEQGYITEVPFPKDALQKKTAGRK